MTIQLLLIGIAVVCRVESAILRRKEASTFSIIIGWLFGVTAVWTALIAIGAWPPFWPTLVIALFGAWLQTRQQECPSIRIIFAGDLLLVIVAGLLSIPPVNWELLVGTAVLLPTSFAIVDWIVFRLIQSSPWPPVTLAGLISIGVLFLLIVTRDTTVRLFSSRFNYLFPESLVETGSTPLPQPATPQFESAPTDEIGTTQPSTPKPAILDDLTSTNEITGTLWSPYLEWRLQNPSFKNNPYDLAADVTFMHTDSGQTHSTEMFYAGDTTWRFRFTGTQTGHWHFSTNSSDPELNGHTGKIIIEPNPGKPGFITNFGNKWGRTGIDRAFIPQYIMIGGPQTYYNKTDEIQYNIQTFIVEHGFNGVHTPVYCRWFDIENQACSRINVSEPNPDPRTFEALETLITKVHAAGGVVHIWMWGDDSRSENPKRWGINGPVDKRLQRYIAARLGPLPGWTMGYGYDLHEWVRPEQLDEWHNYLNDHLGWGHFLGARSGKNQLNQLSDGMDYASYEQHQPDYALYVQTINLFNDKPAFSEDRFRIRDEGREKDYTMEMTRRGLWHSAMAGGVANIWGNLIDAPSANAGLTTSAPYPQPEMIKTYAVFMDGRFWQDMIPCNHLTDGFCLMRPTFDSYIFYQEETASVTMDLTEMAGPQAAVAVDTRLEYAEIDLGILNPTNNSWLAPYPSDWAIAVGKFR